MKKYFTIYKITNRFNNKIYIGCHVCKEINDRYMGSGTEIKEALKKEGRKSFVKEILFTFDTKEEMLSKEKELVAKEFCMDENTYNRIEGGKGYLFYNMVTVKDKYGNTSKVYCDDPRYLSGELIPFQKGRSYNKGTVSVKDKDNNFLRVSVNDERYLSGELVSNMKGVQQTKGKTVVKDKDGNTFQVDKNDPRILNGELVGIATGKISVKDELGNTFRISNDDPRWLSGELKNINKGTVTVKDKNGNTSKVSIDDPRYLSGELVYNLTGNKPWNMKKILVNGVIFESIASAAKKLEIPKMTITNRIKSKNNTNYSYV